MRSRLVNLEAARNSLRPYLEQYLQEHGIDTSKNFNCLNPKHEDKHPSMSCRQYPERAFCFSCNFSADIFEACHVLEGKPKSGIGFVEDNLKYLANKYKVAVDIEDLTGEELYEYRTYQAYELAAQLIADKDFGDYSLVDEEINRRGWNKNKLASWGIGTVNNNEFKSRLKAAGYKVKFLEDIDLVRDNLFDNHNLLFTVFDDHGRPVGFSAKNLKFNENGKNGPRYINTRQTGLECAIFKKGERLYGFDVARDAASPLYIFEGQADVITARHNGLMNCCCTMGTSLTDHHIVLLKKYGILNIVLVFDRDEAGQIAVEKAIDEKFAKEKNFRIKLCQLPNGKDPDELIRNSGFDAFVRLKKWTAFEWRMMKFLEEIGDEPDDEQRRDIAEKMIPIIVSEDSHIRQEEMAKQVARMTGYELSSILSEVKRLRSKNAQEIHKLKTAAIEAVLNDVRYNPDNAELALAECQTALDNINKSTQSDGESSSVLNTLMALKEKDEAKTGEFAGFYMKPDGLGGIAARLNDDWKTDTLTYVGGTEQAGKCQKYDTKILLATGEYKTIEEIVKDKIPTVIGMNNQHKLIPVNISNWIDSGKLECFRVTTDKGIYTEPSETHPYYTLDGWKQVKELKVGDKIAIARNYSCFKNKSPISEEEAIILGGLISEGSLTSAFGFSNTDKEVLDKFKYCVEKKWKTVGYRYTSNTLYVTDPLLPKNKSRLISWLKKYNLYHKNAHTKLIPKEIFQCSLKRIASFLGMLWAGDGWITFNSRNRKLEIGLSLCNLELIKQIRSLLLRFGINTKITKGKNSAQKNGKKFDYYKISIRDIENAVKFYNNIRIPLKYKQDKLKNILDSEKNSIGAYRDNFTNDIWKIINQELEKKNWTLSNLLNLLGEDRNYYSYDSKKDRYRNVSAWKPNHVNRKKEYKYLNLTTNKLRLIGYVLNNQFLIDLAEGDIYFDEITKIETIGKHQCYDLEVPRYHNFIAEDTIVHNTTFAAQMAYEVADNPKNNAICIYHSIDDSSKAIFYKWLCNASESLDLELNHIGNPNYWSKQEGYEFVRELREKAYKKLTQMVSDGKLVVKDTSDGQSIAYAENLVKYHRENNPDKHIILFIDNFHKLPDFGNMKGHERTKKLSNRLKNFCVEQHIAIVCTVEYRKLGIGEMPSNLAIAESRSLSYDATTILHLYNEMHQQSEEGAKLVHQDKNGRILPRIMVKFGKNKVTGYEGREYLNLFPHAARLKAVDAEQVIADYKAREAFLKENQPLDILI